MYTKLSAGAALVVVAAFVASGTASAGHIAAHQRIAIVNPKSSARVKLSLLPLPAWSLGPAARSLPLEGDSGTVVARSNDCGRGCVHKIVTEAGPVVPNNPWMTATDLKKLGLVTGYGLEYGNAESGSTGVTQVWTRVDKYKTSADAGKGLAFWKRWDPQVSGHFARGGLSIAAKREAVAAVGRGRFAVLVGYSAANIAPLFGLDEQFSEGRYVGDVTVWAGNTTDASRLAPRLAKKLDVRIKQALAGLLHAKPVKLPPTPKAGPPPGGPDLAALALKPTDLKGHATAINGLYLDYPFARSSYFAELEPAGPFTDVTQEMWWYPTANEASFESDFWASFDAPHQLDLSSLGDGARGYLFNNSGGGANSAAGLLFCSGRLLEAVGIDLFNGTIEAPEVESIGQTIANAINAAGLGS
jgi:hypothetical protein